MDTGNRARRQSGRGLRPGARKIRAACEYLRAVSTERSLIQSRDDDLVAAAAAVASVEKQTQRGERARDAAKCASNRAI
jgi:hypothetical protein